MCCGSCKNVSCTFTNENGTSELFAVRANTSTQVQSSIVRQYWLWLCVQAGSSWVENCTRFDCMETAVGAVILASGVVCPPFNDTECIQVRTCVFHILMLKLFKATWSFKTFRMHMNTFFWFVVFWWSSSGYFSNFYVFIIVFPIHFNSPCCCLVAEWWCGSELCGRLLQDMWVSKFNGASGFALSCQSDGWAPCCLAVDGLNGWVVGGVACCRGWR